MPKSYRQRDPQLPQPLDAAAGSPVGTDVTLDPIVGVSVPQTSSSFAPDLSQICLPTIPGYHITGRLGEGGMGVVCAPPRTPRIDPSRSSS